jgi:hypothetical protein
MTDLELALATALESFAHELATHPQQSDAHTALAQSLADTFRQAAQRLRELQEPVNWKASYEQACEDADAYKAQTDDELRRLRDAMNTCERHADVESIRYRTACALCLTETIAERDRLRDALHRIHADLQGPQ